MVNNCLWQFKIRDLLMCCCTEEKGRREMGLDGKNRVRWKEKWGQAERKREHVEKIDESGKNILFFKYRFIAQTIVPHATSAPNVLPNKRNV